ncbi:MULTISPECIES: hypothetical protein [Methylobacterium]|uniref:DUF1232 domain-containing protein n=3 Tax=Pseudomonadota TaxID=1224 RepID=A0ABQ4SYC2_9HYPH|nr:MULTISPECIES: hypothetical protein [Methylobacterium]PIU04797.1 MAG: hypothetical protein COT56_18470 [Methylobacterium sp. CG09_land_8_20_14_0_10_71_15]PIU16273.1 MAG: hypothetical protein COT28_01255 [Methylobacterium sp. CG08_land_8_20_14_0_20_71_15]GBU17203.1 hypothetical protein AwMethylo_14180 [Methylobacterium sp.]GJE07882.1 hypothetical protein AOPFMNJM_3214 [Methylobacterium jeotgali]
MFRRSTSWARVRLARCWRATAGSRIYLLALVMALPDILDALVGVDLNSLLPAWMPGAKVATALAILRLFVRAYATKLGEVLPPRPPGGLR